MQLQCIESESIDLHRVFEIASTLFYPNMWRRIEKLMPVVINLTYASRLLGHLKFGYHVVLEHNGGTMKAWHVNIFVKVMAIPYGCPI